MAIENAHVLFVQDDEGIIAITDIADLPDVMVGELVYDGQNVAFLNRDNRFFALPNIPPYLRENLLRAGEVTIVEQRRGDIYAYAVSVRVVENMELPDTWDEYAQNITTELKKKMSAEDFAQLQQAAEKFKL